MAYVTLTGILLGIAAAEFVVLLDKALRLQVTLGIDLHLYMAHVTRWVNGGSFYLAEQLAGPYPITIGVSLYPPTLLPLLIPFLWLPEILWWLIPAAIVAYCVGRLCPARATWPIIALLVVYPRTIEMVITGNPAIWALAALFAATVWRWPAVFVLLKPSLAPFALVGTSSRGWWIALGAMIAITLPVTSLWMDWLVALFNARAGPAGGGPLYSIADIPTLCIPLVAWYGSRRPVPRTPAMTTATSVAQNATG